MKNMKDVRKSVSLLLSAVLLAFALFLGARWFIHAQAEAQGSNCNNNLRLLDSCKEQEAATLHLEAGAILTETQILKYCKDGIMPECRSGGKYSLNPVGKNPTCSLGDPQAPIQKAHWHRLPTGD
jgi:hypothetical protein